MQVDRITAFEGLLAFRSSSFQFTEILEDRFADALEMYTDPVTVTDPVRKPVRMSAIRALEKEINSAVDREREERLETLRQKFEE